VAVTPQRTIGAGRDQARTLLHRVPALQHPSDLDLLVFFAKHPHTLLSTEHIARLLGYPIKEIARSLDALLAAGLVTRAQQQNRTRCARMYVFSPTDETGDVLAALVEQASTREGRVALRVALTNSLAAATPPTDEGQH
jgi:DNA-binding MarR family transcriptional regulator